MENFQWKIKHQWIFQFPVWIHVNWNIFQQILRKKTNNFGKARGGAKQLIEKENKSIALH